MVLFIYITRMASNVKFTLSHSFITKTLTGTTLIFIIYSLWTGVFNVTPNNSIIVESLRKTFSNSSITLVAGLIVYLFFIIVVVTFNVSYNKSSLRPSFFNYDKYS